MSQQSPWDRPLTFNGTGGRDPRQPFGPPATGAVPRTGRPLDGSGQVPVGAVQPTPPRNTRAWVVTVAVLLLVALGFWAAGRYLPDPPAVSPTPSASARPSDVATPGAVSTGLKGSVPFNNNHDQTQGVFTITSHEWTAQGLVLHVKVHLDQGQQRMYFFCLDNTSAHDFDPVSGVSGSLDGQDISAGQDVEGIVVFDKPRGDTTVFLAGSDRRQVAALVVNG